jgi:hypothetical protein
MYVFNKLNLLPSSDVIRRHCQLTNVKEIYFSYRQTLEQIIETRLSQIIKDDSQLHLYRYSASPNRCGYCGENGCNVSLIVTSGCGKNAIYGPKLGPYIAQSDLGPLSQIVAILQT